MKNYQYLIIAAIIIVAAYLIYRKKPKYSKSIPNKSHLKKVGMEPVPGFIPEPPPAQSEILETGEELIGTLV